MSIYAEIVRNALSAHAPFLDVVAVQLTPSARPRGQSLSGRLSMLTYILEARRASSRVRADVCHLLDGSFGYMATGLPIQRTLVTVHDLIPALQAQGRFPVTRPGWAARGLIGSSLHLLRRAGAVHAVSQRTAADVLALTGREVDAVIHNPLRVWLEQCEAGAYETRPPCVLHVGNNSFYKNREGVLHIFASMVRARPALRLLMVGPLPTRVLVLRAGELGIAERVDWVVDPSDAELAALYRQAQLLLFPSLYEGFGWPPLEAMQHGCPVVCADTGSLPEVVGDAALQWDPEDTSGFAAQGLRLLDDQMLAEDLRARGRRHVLGFGARPLAEGLLLLYERVVGS